MNQNEIVLVYISVSLIFLVSVPIFHEGIHVIQNRNNTIKEICFIGLDENKTIGWVSFYGKADIQKDEYAATILTFVYGFGMTLLLIIGLFKSYPTE